MLDLNSLATLGLPMQGGAMAGGSIGKNYAKRELGRIFTPCVHTHSQEAKGGVELNILVYFKIHQSH